MFLFTSNIHPVQSRVQCSGSRPLVDGFDKHRRGSVVRKYSTFTAPTSHPLDPPPSQPYLRRHGNH